MLESHHNKRFKELVNNDEDIVGMIAYCLYEYQKLKTFADKTEIGKEDIEAFDKNTNGFLEYYKEKASRILKNHYQELVDTEQNTFFDNLNSRIDVKLNEVKQAISTQHSKILQDVSTHNSNTLKEVKLQAKPLSFLKEIGIEIAGNFAWVLLLVIIVFLAGFLGQDILQGLIDVLKKIQAPAK